MEGSLLQALVHVVGMSTVSHAGLSDAAANRNRQQQYTRAMLTLEVGDFVMLHLSADENAEESGAGAAAEAAAATAAPAAAAAAARDDGVELRVQGVKCVIVDRRWGVGRITECRDTEPKLRVRWYGNAAEHNGANCPYAAYTPLWEGDGTAYEQDFKTEAVISPIERSAWRGEPADMDDESLLATGLRFTEAYLSRLQYGYMPFSFVYHNLGARKRLCDARLQKSSGGARKQQRQRPDARRVEGASSRRGGGSSGRGGGSGDGGGGGGGSSSHGTTEMPQIESSDESAADSGSESIEVDAAQRRPKRKASDGLSNQQRWEQVQTGHKAASGKGKRVREG